MAKSFFYSGIIEKLKLTDAEIAAIMGHEMAHALREHSRERMSRQVATQTAIGLGAAVFGLSSGQAQVAGLAGDLGLTLPNSRTQETEADLMGLELMARAGYDPNAAVTLWQKMQQNQWRTQCPTVFEYPPCECDPYRQFASDDAKSFAIVSTSKKNNLSKKS